MQSKLLGTSGCTHWNKQEGSHWFQCAWSQAVKMRSWHFSSAGWWQNSHCLIRGRILYEVLLRLHSRKAFILRTKESRRCFSLGPCSCYAGEKHLNAEVGCGFSSLAVDGDGLQELYQSFLGEGAWPEQVLWWTEPAEWHMDGNMLWKWWIWRGRCLAYIPLLAGLIHSHLPTMGVGRAFLNPQEQRFYFRLFFLSIPGMW